MAGKIRQAAQPPGYDRKLPRLQFYIVFTERVRVSDDAHADLKDELPAHLDWIRDLERQGVLFMAGPFRDEQGWEGDGMYILKVGSADEARAIAETCPFHRSGKRVFHVKPWQFNEGAITIHLTQSGMGYGLS